eukprot:TRINITY_DN1349_c0_g2_i1.p1 TRINITY_DN1349_c0_g2~~TRINITY_DN1349_c0_g2_i1.p1  ORF type:complete len:560 (+),score=188.14 TRINITY_DN1349_c0_g2_i1:103-1782(+)
MIIQLLADKGIVKNGQARLVVSVNPGKPLSNAIPSILSKAGLTKKESIQLYFTTASTSLEQGLGVGDVDISECTSSTGGLTISSEGGFSGVGPALPAQRRRRFAANTDAIQPLPVAVDWTMTPQQMGLRPDCFLWIKRGAPREADTETDSSCDHDEVQRVCDLLGRFNRADPYDWICNVAGALIEARQDIPPGQVLWRETLELVPTYPERLVPYILSHPELRRNLPYDTGYSAEVPEGVSDVEPEEWSRALSQAHMNGVSICTAEGDAMGFAPVLSVFQRCCWPNAMSFLSADRRTVDVVAIAAIRQGEEVRLPWDGMHSLLCLSAERRNDFIRRRFGQECRCGRCLRPCEEDQTLTAAFYRPADATHPRRSNRLAAQVMREAHKQSMESAERAAMFTFLEKYAPGPGAQKATLVLHANHWRLSTVRVRLLQWYAADLRRRTDRHLPGILLDQLEMESRVLPKYWPPKRVWWRLWRELLQTQPSHVSALLRRLARDRGAAIDWTSLAVINALAGHWEQNREDAGGRRTPPGAPAADGAHPLSPQRDHWMRLEGIEPAWK